MKLAIMQPYFLPYLGYFQLMASVDKFVVYDDVNFIKRGWVNRNNLLVNGKANLITVPLSNGKRDVLICDVLISSNEVSWKSKLLKAVRLSYAKAPMYDSIYPWFEQWIDADFESISRMNVEALKWIKEYLSLPTVIVESSKIYENRGYARAERLADICKQEHADHYINAAGGRELYEQSQFDPFGVKLSFLDAVLPEYEQQGKCFVTGLSILDVLMNNSVDTVNEMLRLGQVHG